MAPEKRSIGEGLTLVNEKAQRAIIVTPQALVDEIDRYRDELSRAEFIQFSIESLLRGAGEAAPSSEPALSTPNQETELVEGVSRQEFEEFVRRTRKMQQIFIDFMLAYGLEPLERAPAEVQERFKADVAKLLNVEA